MNARILVTGVGGPAAISFIKAISPAIEVHAADMDPHAAGLYLVPENRRVLLPAGADSEFADHMVEECAARKIDVLVPTVDSELLPIAAARTRFEQIGVRILLADKVTLDQCLDKWTLLQRCQGIVNTPRSALFDRDFDGTDWLFPVIVKPRTGSGSRGVHLIENRLELMRLTRRSALIIQEFLPGAEYSVDVLATSAGRIVAAVPRERLKIDSGVAVTSRTVFDPELIAAATEVAVTVGLTYVANVQFRRDRNGTPALLEVNPRFPGTMPLTVASGVNMPALSLANVLGEPISHDIGTFRELAVVRSWHEQFVEVDELNRMARYNDAPRQDRHSRGRRALLM